LVEPKETESSESENEKIAGENNVDCIFYVLEKQIVKDKFYKEVIKRLIARVHRIRPEFRESESWYLLHDDAAAHSSGVVSDLLAKRGIPCYPIETTPMI
jgi:hypothetical protein